MDRTRIRWSKVGRLTAGLIGAAALIAIVPRLLAAPRPQPLPDDVGLTGGTTGAYAYAPVEPRTAGGGERRRHTTPATGEPPRPARYRRPQPQAPSHRSSSGREPTPAVVTAPPPPPAPAAPAAAPAAPAPAAAPEAPPPASPEPPDPLPPPAPPADHGDRDPPPAPSQFGFER